MPHKERSSMTELAYSTRRYGTLPQVHLSVVWYFRLHFKKHNTLKINSIEVIITTTMEIYKTNKISMTKGGIIEDRPDTPLDTPTLTRFFTCTYTRFHTLAQTHHSMTTASIPHHGRATYTYICLQKFRKRGHSHHTQKDKWCHPCCLTT